MSSGVSRANRAWTEIARQRNQQQEMSRNIPSRWTGPLLFYELIIIGGNTLESGQNGIAHIDGSATEVPSDWDMETTTDFDDGWGNAWLRINGVQRTKKALVLIDDTGGIPTMVESQRFYSAGPIYLPVSGSGVGKEVWTGFVR